MFLYGMTILSNGLEKASGGLLEKVLAKMSKNVFSGILFGAIVTTAVQSSSATTVIVVGLVNAGLLQLKGAIGIIMGANIGTTMTTQILRLTSMDSDNSPFLLQLCNPDNFAPILIVVGIIIIMTSKKNKKKTVGEIMIGIGILFIGMIIMKEKMAPLADSPKFEQVFATLKNPVLGVLVGTVVTAVIQSSAASVGMLQVLSDSGVITFSSAFPIIMGTNIGTCATPLLSSIGASKNAKRAALIHFYFNVIGTIVFLTGVYAIQHFIGLSFWDKSINTGMIANFHTIFNCVVTVLFLPWYTVLEKLAEITIRNKSNDDDEEDSFSNENLLDDRFLVTPNVAIAQASEAVVQMGTLAGKNFKTVRNLFTEFEAKKTDKVREREELLDRLEDRVGSYLIKLNDCGLNEDESRQVTALFHLISEYERIGDYSMNIMETAEFMQDKEIAFSDDAIRELNVVCNAVEEIIDLAIEATRTYDMKILMDIEPLEEVVDRLVEELKSVHIDRAKNGICNIEVGVHFLDILTNVERISDHCSNIAIYLIANQKKFDTLKKHEYLDKLHKNGPAEYTNQLEAYSRKYAL